MKKRLEPRTAELAAKQKMDERSPEWYQARRALLRSQAAEMQRRQLVAAGQLTLPIFGDGAGKRLCQTEPETLAVSHGMHVVERKA
jgi:hypothetical protein